MDPLRPQLHLTVDNWMNDPIPFFWRGEYHLFFQHNPSRPTWGNMHWGHAASTDLVNWEILPIALEPGAGYDAEGVWTGSVIEHDGRFYAYYTAIPSREPFLQWQAFAVSENLRDWTKHPCSPVLSSPPQGFGPCWRDPQVWREETLWKMVIGSQREGVGGAALLYESRDLRNWSYIGVLAESKIEETGIDYECPDFFQIDGQWVLLTSREAVHWQVGDYDRRRFTARQRGVCDGPPYSPTTRDASPFYAAKTMLDDQGRRLLFGWLREQRSDEEQVQAGWSGIQSFPRQVLVRDGRLTFDFPDELVSFRRTRQLVGSTIPLPAAQPIEVLTNEAQVTFFDGSSERLIADGGACRLFSDGSVIEAIVDGQPTTIRCYRHERELRVHRGSAQVFELSARPE